MPQYSLTDAVRWVGASESKQELVALGRAITSRLQELEHRDRQQGGTTPKWKPLGTDVQANPGKDA